jgi:hypothetical protein
MDPILSQKNAVHTFEPYFLRFILVTTVVLWLVCLPLSPRDAGSNPAEAMDF